MDDNQNGISKDELERDLYTLKDTENIILKPKLENDIQVTEMQDITKRSEELSTEMETESIAINPKTLIYRIDEVPPWHLTIVFALQQALLVIANPLGITLLIAEIVCIQDDDNLKLQILSSLTFLVGLSTFLMTTFGVRLPIFQGPSKSYIIPLIAMTSLESWKCPATFEEVDLMTNKTITMVQLGNLTVPAQTLAFQRISEMSGSLMFAGIVHFAIGATGVVGFFSRFIGPITIVPTIILIGLSIVKMIVKFIRPNVGIALLVVCCNFIFALLLANKNTPIPWWNRKRGFYIIWYPLHKVFSILISLLIGWVVSAILTASGLLTDDPKDIGYLARTDARKYIIERSDWFVLPYPGKMGAFSVSPGIFANFMMASLLSVLDSIGDYTACARMAQIKPPPNYALNRGIALEGLMSCLGGLLGCCCATVSFGANIGAMGITRVVSRRVFQVLGLIFILFSVIGKVGAVFITIPYPVLGGTTLVTTGIFIGVVMSYLQTIDLTSTRNLAIIGIAILSGLVISQWVTITDDVITTGTESVDNIIQTLLANPSVVGFFVSCTLDNLVSGSLRERGLIYQIKQLNKEDTHFMEFNGTVEDRVYRIPFLSSAVRKSKLMKFIPLFDRNPDVVRTINGQ